MSFGIALSISSGILWTLVYVIAIYRGFKDKSYAMPLLALCFNISWELIFAAILTSHNGTMQRTINAIWFLFDIGLFVTYFLYGKKYFNKNINIKFFYPIFVATLVFSFMFVYFFSVEFNNLSGGYIAFIQNLMMSFLFIEMLLARNNIEGQSIYIAIFKMLGTLAPTIKNSHSDLILLTGAACFILDLLYCYMLYSKFIEVGINPFTRKPIKKAVKGVGVAN